LEDNDEEGFLGKDEDKDEFSLLEEKEEESEEENSFEESGKNTGGFNHLKSYINAMDHWIGEGL
jgi:hypothetical protein